MKQRFLSIATMIAIVATACFTSCAKEELAPEIANPTVLPLGPSKHISAKASLSTRENSNNDKAVVNLNNRTVTWEPGDQVRINNAVFTISDIRDNDTVASIEGDIKPIQQASTNTDEYYSVYPNNAITNTSDWSETGITPNIKLSSFERQKYNDTKNLMVSYVSMNRGADLKHICYKNLCAVFVVGLKSTAASQKVGKISLYTSTNENAVLWTPSAALSFSGNNRSAVPTLTSSATKTNRQRKITLDCSENGGVTINNSSYTYFYFYIPMIAGANIKDLCMEVYNEDSTKMMRKTANSSSIMLERNKIYTNHCDLTFDISGYIDADFSISATQTTKFSKGNLRYRASDKNWRFATQQYNIEGVADNQNISATNNKYIDLFGYGTSGYNGKYPYLTASGIDLGYAANEVFPNQNISNTNYDWGVYNIIDGNPKGAYYTWTLAQAQYMIHTRPASKVNGVENARFALCRVNIGSSTSPSYRNGVLLLPDVYKHPSGATAIKKATINKGTNSDSTYYNQNTFSKEDIQLIQAAGGVFLPSAGFRGYSTSGHGDGKTLYTNINKRNFWSMYWTGTNRDKNDAYYVILVKSNFGADPNDPPYFHKYGGRSVRLITNNYHK